MATLAIVKTRRRLYKVEKNAFPLHNCFGGTTVYLLKNSVKRQIFTLRQSAFFPG